MLIDREICKIGRFSLDHFYDICVFLVNDNISISIV
jgi:hypothetical protein